jgi:tRNA (adenine37-N6)-methyltransferase
LIGLKPEIPYDTIHSTLVAADETPVLDIKPYFMMERVENCEVPSWCQHWPKWQEKAADFPWQNEINF